MPSRIPDPRAGGPEGNRLPGAVSINRPSAEQVDAANAPASSLHAHVPEVELLVDGRRSHGDYAVLEIRLPSGLDIPRHVWRHHDVVARLLAGTLELHEDDRDPVVVHAGSIGVRLGSPIAARVLTPARLVVILTPATAAELLPAAAAPDVLPDDRAALLAAAGITALPALRLL